MVKICVYVCVCVFIYTHTLNLPISLVNIWASLVAQSKVGDLGLIPGLGRFPGEGNGNPLQYSSLDIPMDGGAWWATVHRVSKSWRT